MRVYKILYEAILRLLFEEYEAEDPSLRQKIQQYLQNIDESSNFSDIIDRLHIRYSTKLIQIKDHLKENSGKSSN